MKENLLLGKLGKYRGIEDMPCGVCHKVNVLEMKCLRSLVRVSRMDRVRNEEVRMRLGIEGS